MLGRKLLIRKVIYFTHCLIILYIAYLLNRFFPMLLFMLFYNVIQNSFNYRFHADTLIRDNPIKADNVCKIITIAVEIIYMLFCKNLNISIYSNLFVIFVIATINALLQVSLERLIIHSSSLRNKDIIEKICLENNISKTATQRLIKHYVNGLTFKQIAEDEFVEVETIKQSIRRTKRKLKL